MTKIVKGLTIAATLTVVGLGAIVVVAVAPLVSLVVAPIFALKALPEWIIHRSLYNRTLTDGSRAKLGRVEGQDYSRWDGKTVTQIQSNSTEQERMHELIGAYVHGKEDDSFKTDSSKQAVDSPFRTQEDLKWLKKEFSRREIKDLLDSDLKMLRAFSKALIPVVGAFWVLFSETDMGGASNLTCRVCMMGGSDSEDTHWKWREAIKFHQKILSNNLSHS